MNNIIQNSNFKTQNYNSPARHRYAQALAGGKFKIDLKQRCFQFSLDVIALTDDLPKKRSAWVITDQLIRSSTSIGANLVEARASSSRLEFKKFYEIALKSANETIYWLELLRDAKLADMEKVENLLVEVGEISRMIGAGVIKLKQRNL